MAGSTKEVDLVIRAKDLSQKVLKDSLAAIDEVTSALAEQAKQADKTDASLTEMESGLKGLAKAEQGIAKEQANLEKALSSTALTLDRAAKRQQTFEQALSRSKGELAEARANAAAAAEAYSGYANALGKGADATKAQQKQLDDLAKKVEKADKAVEKAGSDTVGYTIAQRDAVEQTQKLAAVQNELVAAQSRVADAMREAGDAADRSRARIQAAKDTQAKAAEEEKRLAKEKVQAQRDAEAEAKQLARDTAREKQRLARETAKIEREAAQEARQAKREADREARQVARENAREAKRLAKETADELKRNAKEAELALKEEEKERRRNKAALDAFTGSQRESLSWYQRLRGEIIALAASYVGLQGALGLAKDSLDAFQAKQQTQNVLGVAIGSGDPKEIAKEYDYIRGVADRLGFRLQALAKQYSKFSASARIAGATQQETRFIFEQVAKAVRVLGLSDDDARGAFLALEQMFSKGKISAEELRQQLGERLPGAVKILEKALDLKPGQLDKMLEKGAIGADKVLTLAKGIGDTFGKNLGPATKSMGAELGRFQTAFDDFKESIANMGFADAFTKFLRDMTTFFKSEEGVKMAQRLSEAFTKVLAVLRFVIENFNVLKEVVLLIVGIKVAQWFLGIVTSATKAVEWIKSVNTALIATQAAGAAAGAGMDTATGATTRLSKALLLVQRTLLWLGAFFVGWEIGTILDEKFDVVRRASQLLANDMIETWVNMKHGLVILFADASVAVQELAAKSILYFRNLKNGFFGMLMDSAKKFGLDGLAEFIGKGITQGMQTGFEDGIDAAKQAAQQARVRRDAELKQMLESRAHSPVRLTSGAKKRVENGELLPGETEMPGKSGVPTAPPDDSKAIAKRENLERSLSDQLNALNAKNEKAHEESLADRISATERAYKHIQDTIEKFKKAGGKDVDGTPLGQVENQVAAMKNLAVEQEIVKFNTEELARGEKQVNDLMAERKNRVAEINTDQANGLIDAEEAFRQIKAVNDELLPQIQRVASVTAGFAQGLKGTTVEVGNNLDALISKMSRVQKEMGLGGAKSPTGAEGQQAFNQAMQQANTLLQERNAQVATYNDLVKLGSITQTEANDKIKAAFEATQPQIDKAVEGMRALIQAMLDAGVITQDKFDALNAQLTLMATNAQYVDRDMARIKDAFESNFVSGFQDTVNSLGDAVAGLATGTMSWGDAWRSVGKTALQALGNIAQGVANAITQMIAMRIAGAAIGMFAGAAGAASGVTVGGPMDISNPVGIPIPHGGGVVGPSGMSGPAGNRTRSVNMAVFRNAPRYHSGGVIGLRSNEQAAILERGEEVLRRDNPRHIMNQTRDAAVAGRETAIRNILVDDPNRLPDFMQSAQGEKTLVTVLGRNRAKARKALGL